MRRLPRRSNRFVLDIISFIVGSSMEGVGGEKTKGWKGRGTSFSALDYPALFCKSRFVDQHGCAIDVYCFSLGAVEEEGH